MFFVLSKVLLFLISPFIWIVILLLFAWITKNPKYRKRSFKAALIIGIFFSNHVIFSEFCRVWEVHGTPIRKTKNYDIGIVLGGMTEWNNDLKTLSIRRGADRIWQAISLYKAKKIKKIFISGDHGYIIDKGLHESTQLKALLVKWGIPKEDILTECISKNTYENAVESKKTLRKLGFSSKKLLLITSGTHMRRARACFAKQNIQVDCFSTDLHTGPKRYYSFENFILPDVHTYSEWHKLNKEIVGYIMYDITEKI